MRRSFSKLRLFLRQPLVRQSVSLSVCQSVTLAQRVVVGMEFNWRSAVVLVTFVRESCAAFP
jgi:hypothetical protein